MLGCQNNRGEFEVARLSLGVYIGLSYMFGRHTYLYKLALLIIATAFGVRVNHVIISCKHAAFHTARLQNMRVVITGVVINGDLIMELWSRVLSFFS